MPSTNLKQTSNLVKLPVYDGSVLFITLSNIPNFIDSSELNELAEDAGDIIGELADVKSSINVKSADCL
ncbi:MAG: hypothetical protein ACI4L7_01260 [Christensenellales bacterium]